MKTTLASLRAEVKESYLKQAFNEFTMWTMFSFLVLSILAFCFWKTGLIDFSVISLLGSVFCGILGAWRIYTLYKAYKKSLREIICGSR